MITCITYREYDNGVIIISYLDDNDFEQFVYTTRSELIKWVADFYEYTLKYAQTVFENLKDTVVENYIKTNHK